MGETMDFGDAATTYKLDIDIVVAKSPTKASSLMH